MIAPIFKGGSKLEPPNYRPVSLTSLVIKVFERVIQVKVLHYLESNKLVSCNQHGFRKGCSCLSELLAHFNEIYENLGNSHDTDTIYLDFSKAFDKNWLNIFRMGRDTRFGSKNAVFNLKNLKRKKLNQQKKCSRVATRTLLQILMKFS